MSLRSEYDLWHEKIYREDREHNDASSPWYQLVREQVGSVAGLRILEVACGRGGFLKELAKSGARVTGCDFSASALRVARGKQRENVADLPEEISLTQGDAQNLPFASDSFDVVVSCETIEHLPDAHAAMRELYRVTRTGGKLLLTTPNYANFTGLYDLYLKLRSRQIRDDQPFDRRQYFPQIRKCVRVAGWHIVKTDGIVHQFPLLPGHSPWRLKAADANRALRKVFSPFALHYFVMALKEG